MIEVDDVDGVDRGVRVGVCGEQDPPRHREEVHRLLEEVDAAHLRHPVIGDEHGHRFTTQLEFLERVERIRAGLGTNDAVPLAIVAAKVAGHRTRNGGVVVDGQNYGFPGLGRRSSHQ